MEPTTQTTLLETFSLFEKYLPNFARTGIFSPGAQQYAGMPKPDYRPVAMVTDRRNETEDTISLTLMPPTGYPTFRAGQHIDLAVVIRGVRHVRQYSITGDVATQQLRITVKRQQGGIVSGFLYEHAFAGKRFEIGAPRGEFVLPATRHSAYIFCSAGSGITPVFAMVRELLAAGTDAEIYFCHAARSHDSVIFRAELEHLAETHANFFPHLFLSEAEGIEKRRLNFETVAPLLPPAGRMQNAAVFLCGPGDFVKNLEAGFSASQNYSVRSEYFTLPAAGATEGQVHFLKTGLATQAKGNLLEVAEASGLKPKHGCRRGICHECKAHKISGTVKNILTGRETQGEENIQLCISEAVGSVEVEL